MLASYSVSEHRIVAVANAHDPSPLEAMLDSSDRLGDEVLIVDLETGERLPIRRHPSLQ